MRIERGQSRPNRGGTREILRRGRGILGLIVAAAALSLPAVAPATAGQTAPLLEAPHAAGEVLDPSGAPVSGAIVRLEQAGGVVTSAETGPDGQFRLTGAAGNARLLIAAPGFSAVNLAVVSGQTSFVRVLLQPAPLNETVTVTASRGVEEMAAPASTTVVSSADIFASGGAMVDDILRNTPGFSLNRRSSSRASPPPSQGVALRGIPGIGASRTMVLADGMPLNDPFGGWVYWNRVPVAAIDRIEVLRGAAGDLYGADAMGGVIQLLTFAPGSSRMRAVVEGGSQDTARTSIFAGTERGRWTFTGAGEWENTSGYYRVPAADRGLVDRPMANDYQTGFGTIGYTTERWSAHGRLAGYDERRRRGTPLLVDNTTWWQASGGLVSEIGRGTFIANLGAGRQQYVDNFSSISSDRNSERLTTDQRIPASFETMSGQWTRSFGAHVLLAGGEGRHVSATQHETTYSVTGAASAPVLTGGDETSGSAFARVSLAPLERVQVVLGARGDFWSSNPLPSTGAPQHGLQVFSPTAAVIWRPHAAISWRAGVSRASRTPTLDELHRSSRQGNVLTLANPRLRPERLTGIETSVLVSSSRASARLTGFVNWLDGMVTNVTIASTPSLITRQKDNVDRSRAAGIEFETDIHPAASLMLSAQGMLTASEFVQADGSELAGNRVPQMPRYQVGASATWAAPYALTLSSQWRLTGAQFDDDRNTLELERFSVVDATISRSLDRRVQVYVAIENLFDVEYDVGRTPNRTIGLPRTIRGGLRMFLP